MVYVDLLVLEDLISNYCILLGVSVLLNRHTKLSNIFLASVIGCIPLIFIFTKIDKIVIFLISIIFSIIMSLVAFKYKDIIYTIKNVIYLYLVSIFLAGSIYLINIYFLPKLDNTFLNFLALIIIFPIITFTYIKSIKKIKITYSNYYLLAIYLKDKPKITVSAFLDTGNTLKDPYKHRPIILIKKDLINYQDEKIIIVPYNTIDSHGIMECFKPEKIYLDKVGEVKNVLIGLIDEVGIEGADCILNKKILEGRQLC